MKRAILYSIVSLILTIILLFRFEFFYINISPNNTYHLNLTERQLINDSILSFREKVKLGKFDEIKRDLTKGRQDSYWEGIILKDIQRNQIEFGNPLSWKIFRVAQPQFNKEKGETVYIVDYLTKFEKEERHESFGWLVRKNNEISLIFASIKSVESTQWRIEERDKQKLIVEKYPNEIIIPYADRYIEFRY